MQPALDLSPAALPNPASPPHDRSWHVRKISCPIHKAGRESVAATESPDGTAPVVFFVDHDLRLRESLEIMCETLGWVTHKFRAARAFLESPPLLSPSCLVLETAMLDLDVPEIQERVAIDRPGMPIILITGSSDQLTTLQAKAASTVNPFAQSACDELLVGAIANALERSRPALDRWARTRDLRCRYALLSQRERQVMNLVVHGRLNKQVGDDLGISEITVKAHRGSIMRKMRAASLASLVTMAARLGLGGAEDDRAV